MGPADGQGWTRGLARVNENEQYVRISNNGADVSGNDQEADRERMAGLAKGLAVIAAFERERDALSVSRAAALAGLSRAAARRCLRTLQQLGYVTAAGDGYALTPRVLRLAQAYVASNPLARVVQPIVEATSQRLRHSMTVAVRDHMDAVVIARTLVQRALAGGMALGTRLPAYCSANGRILLSDLADADIARLLCTTALQKRTPHTKTDPAAILAEIGAIRRQGFAINDQEVELGVRSIAIPLRDRNGATIASVSLSVPADAGDRRHLIRLLPELEAARARISAAL
jgi:IclR family pca regulon transcriptional regulator